jgi:hypothetical protein
LLPKTKYITPYRWVTGCEWADGRLQLRFEDIKTGEPGTGTFDSLMPELKLSTPGILKRNLPLTLSHFRLASTEEYLQALGCGHLPSDGQAVYEVSAGRTRILVPAQVLMLSLYGTTGPLRRAMLSPGGPELLMRPYLKGTAMKLRTDATGRTAPPHRRFDMPRLTWMHMYPSAKAGWASIFHHASSGRIDLRLPAALVQAAVRGHQSGTTLAATKLIFWSLEPLEKPAEFARIFAPESFLLKNKSGQDARVEPPIPVQEERLAGLRCVWEGFSDAEWPQVKQLLWSIRRPQYQKYSTKYILEAVLRKYGRPCTWAEAAPALAKRMAARTYAHRLKRDGCWVKLLDLVSTFERSGAPA